MNIYEYVGNPHVHTRYSDGTATHAEIAQAAADANLNFVITTDHNVWVKGCEGYYGKVLLLIGEELHDVRRQPQANHLLAYNVEEELSPLTGDPQELIEEVNQRGGFCYLAHPAEYGSPLSPDYDAIPWENWDVSGYVGLEIWNYMSEFKAMLRHKLAALFYGLFPSMGIMGPFKATLRRWDQLLSQGKRVAAIGGADAHAQQYRMGPFERVLFPYRQLFRRVNTHIITDKPINGIVAHDREIIYDALRAGHTWVGYDLPASTRGFQFYARSGMNHAWMGDDLARIGAVVFEVHTPEPADIRLVQNGQTVARTRGDYLKHTTAEPGPYRVEAYKNYKLGNRGWIFSSPIYVS